MAKGRTNVADAVASVVVVKATDVGESVTDVCDNCRVDNTFAPVWLVASSEVQHLVNSLSLGQLQPVQTRWYLQFVPPVAFFIFFIRFSSILTSYGRPPNNGNTPQPNTPENKSVPPMG